MKASLNPETQDRLKTLFSVRNENLNLDMLEEFIPQQTPVEITTHERFGFN